MILMADDVIATVNDETDAVIFHSLISQFEKLSNLKLNPMKSVAYGTPGAKNRMIQNWKIPMNAITDPQFVYLGIPLNGLDWERRLKVTLKKIPPLWDKAIEVRTLYINTYVFSTLYYFDQHHCCPPDILTTFKQQITKRIQPPNGFKISTSKIQTPIWLGGFGLLDLSHQMMGRKAF
ncbi:unnamed protein product [Ambrosiozyma monospora]|uniref:Unnamed protein product n=1 Tax=Ambrosiozyma monospora TaxID=43982 RepID=A0ACB5SS45_AMBMO|nr:unnamed protein product [Ambrosiozyma monospora]